MVTREDRVGERRSTKDATLRDHASDAANTATIWNTNEAFRAIPSATNEATTTAARI